MKRKRRQRIWPAFLVIAIMLVLIVAYVAGMYMMNKPDPNKFCEGIYVEDINISGMTMEEAQAAVDAYVSGLSSRAVEVDVNGTTVSTTLAALEYQAVATDVLVQAMQIGKDGNIFSNYATIKDLESNKKVYNLEFTFSEKRLKSFIKKECNALCQNAKDSKIKMKNGTLVYTEAREGVAIDMDTTVANVKEAITTQTLAQVIHAEAVVVVEEPTVTKELASRCKDKIGTFSTTFSASNINRSQNVTNAARLINGTVVYPGETFSVHDTISPLTEENGYAEAGSYSNGQVVDSLGGGVCQVSTTLYNAVLRAELEIVERSPHSMVVSYVKPAMDAAIAGDYKDFKFRNDTNVPIYIAGGTYSGTIYFTIYGEETRSRGRTVTFESEILETIKPGKDKVTIDKTKPTTYKEITQEAHVGYKAVLWKLVTEDGKTTKTQVNSSTYKAEPRYIIKGSKKVKPTPTPAPKKTPKPKATAAPEEDEEEVTPEPTEVPVATEVPAAEEE